MPFAALPLPDLDRNLSRLSSTGKAPVRGAEEGHKGG